MSLQLSNITKEFALKGKEVFTAVSNVSLKIHQGEFCTLLGPSGCGKTTLLRMIAGFEVPTSGEIHYHDKIINNVPPQKRGFPMVFQSYALFPHKNVRDNISYGLQLRRYAKEQIREKVDSIISLIGLNENQDKFPHQMSGGQQQRVALARALVLEPEIILFDEPLSNLDAKLRVYMRDEIKSIQKKFGITAIYVTHDQEEAFAISDRIAVINKGKIEQFDPPHQLYYHPNNEFVAKFVGDANIITINKTSSNSFHILGVEYQFDNTKTKHVDAISSVMIRPENIDIVENAKHNGIIKQKTFLGSKLQFLIECNGILLTISAPYSDELYHQNSVDISFRFQEQYFHFL